VFDQSPSRTWPDSMSHERPLQAILTPRGPRHVPQHLWPRNRRRAEAQDQRKASTPESEMRVRVAFDSIRTPTFVSPASETAWP
jgi:hypothetical protein